MRAIDGARTRGLDLGKVARYQLRHYRIHTLKTTHRTFISIHPKSNPCYCRLPYIFRFLYLLDLLVKPSTD